MEGRAGLFWSHERKSISKEKNLLAKRERKREIVKGTAGMRTRWALNHDCGERATKRT